MLPMIGDPDTADGMRTWTEIEQRATMAAKSVDLGMRQMLGLEPSDLSGGDSAAAAARTSHEVLDDALANLSMEEQVWLGKFVQDLWVVAARGGGIPSGAGP